MALDIMRMASHVQQGFEDGAKRKRENEGRRLIALAAQGDKEAVKQLYSVDPQAAQQMQTQQKAMDSEVANLMWRGATAIKNATPEQKAATYSAVLAEVSKHPKSGEWTAQLPAQYDPTIVDPAIDQVLAQTGLYQDKAKASEEPAQLQFFDGMMARGNIQKGSPKYEEALNVFMNLTPKARAQVVADANGGVNVATFGGGQDPTSQKVMEGDTAPSAPVTDQQAPRGNGATAAMEMSQFMESIGGRVNSTFRTTEHNASPSVGGKPNSKHLSASAFDVTFDNPKTKAYAINAAKKNNFKAIDEGDHVHFQYQGAGAAPAQGNQLMGPKKGPAANGSYSQLSTAEVQSMGLPAGTVAQRGPNGQVSVISKPEAKKTKEVSADVIKNAAQLPALARRIDRLAQASEKISGMFDGGALDQYAISATNEATELESAAAQLRPLLLSFVRVPGIGSQSDLEARLDGMQYPDISQPPATRKKNIEELRTFIIDLSNAYKSMAGNGSAPAAPSGGLSPAQQALLDKY